MSRFSETAAPRYASTAQVAAALGLSVTTVKRWVDEGILPAHKTAGGHRKLLLADVIRFSREGRLPQVDLSRLIPAPRKAKAIDLEDLAAQLGDKLIAGEADAVRGLLFSAYHAGQAIADLADRVISPAMSRVGHEWSNGAIDVLHEHRGMQLVAGALFELNAQLESNAERDRPVALGGAIEFDHYLLPTLLVQMTLRDNGWNAINLGPNTPLASLRKAVREFRPRLIWVSVSYLADAAAFETEYRRLFDFARSHDVAVALGGRALPDGLRATLPYTTFGDGLTHLAAFARTLHPRRKPPKRGRPRGS